MPVRAAIGYFDMVFGVKQLERGRYRVVQMFDDSFGRLTHVACVTDGPWDGQTDRLVVACSALRLAAKKTHRAEYENAYKISAAVQHKARSIIESIEMLDMYRCEMSWHYSLVVSMD